MYTLNSDENKFEMYILFLDTSRYIKRKTRMNIIVHTILTILQVFLLGSCFLNGQWVRLHQFPLSLMMKIVKLIVGSNIDPSN